MECLRQDCDFVAAESSTFSVVQFNVTVVVSDTGEPLCGFLRVFQAGLAKCPVNDWLCVLCLLCHGTLPICTVPRCFVVFFLFSQVCSACSHAC